MINKSSEHDCGDRGQDCSKAEALIDNFIDGLLEDSEQIFIKRHLENCPGCKDGYRFEETFHLRLKALSPICMPEKVKSQIKLTLGFPGISTSTEDMGIPKGIIPKGEIPKNDFFDATED